MGFVAGFAGGVTLTLSLTYLALLTHTRNRQAQSAVLRSQATTLDTLVPPDPSLPLSARRRNATVLLPDGTYRPRESLEQYQREVAAGPAGSFVETAKTRWNSEVLSAVRWAQNKDWGRVREEVEDGVARLVGVELSKEPVRVPADEEEEGYPPSPPPPKPYSRVSHTLHQARDTTLDVAHAMRDEAKEVVLEAREVAAEAAREVKGAVAKGVEKAHELVAAAHLAEERAEAKMEARMMHTSDIERALAERYDSARREERMKKSVEEVLRERYIPMDSRDNSQLRGI